jgi:drug/metabolite transporter (DMT)-like permease
MYARWDALTIAALTVGVVAVSTSGALIAYAAAPALAIAFWRNALASAALAPVTLATRRAELGTHKWLWSVLAGLALAVHFGTWVPSVKLTSVATATALVCTQPIWAGLIEAFRGTRLSRLTWIGMAVAVAGAGIATGADLGLGGTALLGDLLAICGAISAAVYTLLGQKVRETASTMTYTTICYSVCAIALLAVCLITNTSLTGYPSAAWLALIALTVGPQLMGHSMLNYALKRVSATTVSVIVLLEVPGAILLAWAWLNQRISLTTMIGIAVLLAGVTLVVLSPAGRSALHQQPASDL